MALTNKERQRNWRTRHKGLSVKLAPTEVDFLLTALTYHIEQEAESLLHFHAQQVLQGIYDKIDSQTADRKNI
tara:strand:+ start:11909 stop:12127 length:219 start_codon:yes stop_codon:yes gene_type:complete